MTNSRGISQLAQEEIKKLRHQIREGNAFTGAGDVSETSCK